MDPSEILAREYSAKADAYARHWAPVIGPMGRPLFGELPLASARWVLDLGTGTGASLPDLEAAVSEGRIVAVDRAEGMLRLAQASGTRAALAVMDALGLGLRANVVDVATLVFVLFHIPDPVAALGEVRRVLRPGGRIGIVVWGEDAPVPGLSFWTEALDSFGAAPDPRDPGVMHQALMDTPDKLEKLVRAGGYGSVRVRRRIFEHRWTVDELIALQVGHGMASRRLVSLSSTAAAECQSQVRARLESLPEHTLIHRPEVLFAVARKPD